MIGHNVVGRVWRVLILLSIAIIPTSIFIMVHGSSAHADNTTYYIDCSATSDGNGSQSNPWNALSDVNTFNAPGGFSPGDQLLFKGDTTCNGQLHPLGSGSSSASITIDMYGSGARPHIDGQGNVTDTVFLSNQQYWNIQNLEVTNDSGNNAQRTGVRVVNSTGGALSHIHILNLSVHNVKGYANGYYSQNAGISVEADSNSSQTLWDDVLIQGNTITTVDRIGIFVGPDQDNAIVGKSTNILIQNNTITDSGGDDILVYVTSGATIQYNTGQRGGSRSNAVDCQASNYCNKASAGMWAAKSDHVTFQYNVDAFNQNSADGQGFDSDFSCHSCTFQYNYSHDNTGGFLLVVTQDNVGTIVRDNISQNDATNQHGVISFVEGNGDLAGLQIYNNTIYVPKDSRANIIDNYFNALTQPFSFTNNIVYLAGNGGYASDSSASYDDNLFYGNHPSSEPADSHKLTNDPLFVKAGDGGSTRESVDGYKLQNGSPALSSGTLISDNGGKDYFGNTISSGDTPNRGAYNGPGVVGSSIFVSNPGFESGTLSPWYVSGGNPTVVNTNARSGSYALQTGVSYSGANQDMSNLSANTTYILTGWAKNANAGDTVYIGVKNFGGTETSTGITGTDYAQGSVTFTTGSASTSATIYCWKNGGAGQSYCDDFSLAQQ